MASLKVDKLRAAIKGGVRSNLFEVVLTPPNIPGVDFTALREEQFTFLVRSGQIPALSLAPIEVPFRGSRLKIPGDRAFDPWTMTVYNDDKMLYRSLFERWQNAIKGTVSNVAAENYETIFGSIIVRQLNQQGEVVKPGGNELSGQWILHDCWPSDIAAIDLSSDNENAVSDFTVTWQYQYWSHAPFTDDQNAN